MRISEYVGKTLKELAEETHITFKPFRVFVLSDPNDDVGQALPACYAIKQIVTQFPAVADTVVMTASNYFGETILRVAIN